MCALWSMEAAAVVKRWPTSGIPVKETKIAFWHVATISGRHCYPKQTIGSPCDDDSDCMSNNCGLLTCRSPEEEEENVQISPLTGPSPLPTIAPTAGNPSSTTPGGDRITEESIMCFTLRAEAGKGGGCVAREQTNTKDVDALFFQVCSSNDDAIQWRLDEKQRFRSKVNDDECLQASRNPGSGSVGPGTCLFVGSCEGGPANTELFQVMVVTNELLLGGSYPTSGNLQLASRLDLCMTHRGDTPLLGESDIMLAACSDLQGDRAEGWTAENPCVHVPDSCDLASPGKL